MKNTGCCMDEKKEIKLTLDQQKTADNQINNSYSVIAVSHDIYFYSLKNSFHDVNIFAKLKLTYLHTPPNLQKQDTQAVLSTFII